jgi:beta-galactosidase/beta-glucuronidase
MKKLGFNMVRKHLKVEPERWYYWCDTLGLLAWQDISCGDGGAAASKERDGVVNTPVAAQEFESELKAMIEQHYNHPSIIMWIIFNEGWG